MPTAVDEPTVTTLDPDLEQAVREAIDQAKPCYVIVNGVRCDQAAEWALYVGCGCRRILCCPGHKPLLTEARGVAKLLCHIGIRGCGDCSKCGARACAGRDRWEPLP